MLYDIIFWVFLLLFLLVVAIIVIKNVSKNKRDTRAHKQGGALPQRGFEEGVTGSHNEETMTIECPKCGTKNSIVQRPQSSQNYRCGKCGAKIIFLETIDTNNEVVVSSRETSDSTEENTSGQGKLTVVPQEIKGWNWGACLLGVIWGAGNNVWWSLLIFIPYFNFVWIFVMGVKGSEWAWKSKRWDNIEHFKMTQKKWRDWGIGITAIIALIVFISALS